MVFPGSLRAGGLGRDALGVAIAGLGTCALTGYTWWSARGGVPTPDVSAAILILIAIGATAGLISGRFRAAPASWAAAVIGSMLAYSATVTIDPGLPAPNSGFSGNELLNAAFLLPFIAGGHLLGAWARIAQWRGAVGAAVAGLATCALCLYSFSSAPHGVPSPGASPAIGMWMAIGIWIAIGATAGLASGRFRDAPASWAAAVIGFTVAYVALYAIELGGTAPVELLLYGPVTLLLFITGGHLLGACAWGATRTLRKAEVRG